MSVFNDSDCLDRVGAVIAGVAGVAGTVVGGAAVGGGLLAAACAGRAALIGRLDAKSADAAHVTGEFIEQFKGNWEEWSALSPSATRKPEDLKSAALSFEEYFNTGDPRSLPSGELIMAQGRNAEKITQEMLATAARRNPDVYSDTPINALNRVFFKGVIQSALSRLLAMPDFANTLQPAFQTLVANDLAEIKEDGKKTKADVAEIKEDVEELNSKFDEQAKQWQSCEQYQRQLHALGQTLRERETELRLTLKRLDSSESKTQEQQDLIIEAKVDLQVVERERSDLQNKLANIEASYAETIEQLQQAQQTNEQLEGQVPALQLEAAKEAINQGPDAAYEAYNTIVETAVSTIAIAAYQAAELAKTAIRYPEALKHYRKAAVLDDQNALYLNELAAMHQDMGQYPQAEPLYLESLAIRKKQFGDEHPDVATSLNNLAELYRAQGRYTEAEPLYLESLAIWKKQLGGEHPDVATSLNNLALLYQSQGRYAEAEPLYLESRAIRKKQLGDEHPLVATILNNLAGLYRAQGKYSDAEPLYLEALAIRKKQLGDEHPDVATSLNNLALLYQSQGKYSDAEPLYLEAIEILENSEGREHPNTQLTKSNYADLQALMKGAPDSD